MVQSIYLLGCDELNRTVEVLAWEGFGDPLTLSGSTGRHPKVFLIPIGLPAGNSPLRTCATLEVPESAIDLKPKLG